MSKKFKTGLVLGKFMPLHTGHLALINFASSQCEHLYVLLCVHEGEIIPASIRLQWLGDVLENKPGIQPVLFEYDPADLTNSSESSEDESAKWAAALRIHFPDVEAFFSSEDYGDLVAKHWPCTHVAYDKARLAVPISGSVIRENPFQYWEYLPREVQPYFVKQVVLSGTESTGKTTLTKRLAEYFNTNFVHEVGRDIVPHSDECTPSHLQQIAGTHARNILKNRNSANKILILDTDINITRSYSRFLFNEELHTDDWVEKSNRSDLYLFLENDVPYIQDGTRLNENDRNKLHESHREELEKRAISYVSLKGDWDERFEKAVSEIKRLMGDY